jgi:hypothetical protein
VRLFPQVHGALLEELARACRGSRAARVVYLMTVGLTLERALQAARASSPPSAHAMTGVGINDADGAFLDALLDGADGLGDGQASPAGLSSDTG